MIAHSVEVENFRNYASLNLSFQPGVNVLFGENGQGKTNILEAIYLCTCASSHRTSKDKELIRRGERDYRVALDFENDKGYTQRIEIQYLEAIPSNPQRQKNQRLIRHNGLRLERVGHLMGLFNAVIFAPEDLRMVKDGPQNRRRFLDLLISQIKPTYFSLLQQFNLILLQRNTLLKRLRENNLCVPSAKTDPFDLNAVELDTWDESLATVAAEIIEIRHFYVEQLSKHATKYHANIVNGIEKLKVRYQTISGLSFDNENSVENNKDKIFSLLQESRDDDIRRGITSHGPHRDDLIIKLNGMSLRVYGSQGQQRTSVLSLKMAELKLIEEATRNRPLLLLDDVMSELDQGRRENLVNSIRDYQVIITCTEAEMVDSQMREIESVMPITYYHVQNQHVGLFSEDI